VFCSKCGGKNEEGASYCSSCGAPHGPAHKSAGSPESQPTVVNVYAEPAAVGPYGTPGTGALWLSIFGFVCGVPAILGIVFGVGARREAKRRGRSAAKANWAIGIGLLWIIIIGAQWGFIMNVLSSSDGETEAASSEQMQDAVSEAGLNIEDRSPVTRMADAWDETPEQEREELCEIAMNTTEVVGRPDSPTQPSASQIQSYNVGTAALELVSEEIYLAMPDEQLLTFFAIRC